MIDLFNGIAIGICSFVLGLAFHSLYIHAVKKGKFKGKLKKFLEKIGAVHD